MPPTTIIRKLDLVEYQPTYEAMQQFTAQRHSQTNDEIWLLQHPPVFTLGRNTLPEHLTPQSEISVIPIDRGGQITYHGPGQLVVYLLLDLKRLKMGVRELVHNVERSIISVLGLYAIDAYRKKDAPGVYVDNAKIAALGFRIKHGYSYHGLSLNIDMDLTPYQRINPCGYPDLVVTDLKQLGVSASFNTIEDQLSSMLIQNLR